MVHVYVTISVILENIASTFTVKRRGWRASCTHHFNWIWTRIVVL